MDAITFSVGDQQYALPLEEVREVLRMVHLTPVPDAPPEVLGAINVHGSPVLVLDVRQRLGLPHRPPTPSSPLILVNGSVALLIDKVHGVVQHDPVAEKWLASRRGNNRKKGFIMAASFHKQSRLVCKGAPCDPHRYSPRIGICGHGQWVMRPE